MQRPAPLRPGDTVGVLALASRLPYERVQPALDALRRWGLNVVEGASLKSEHFTFAGSDAVRAADFQRFLDDSSIKAIISARGGYGSSRLLDGLRFTKFRQQPKWIVGFSDITAVHCHVHTFGIESLHATMPSVFFQDKSGASLESLRKFLFGETPRYQVPAHAQNRAGTGTGALIGGNLCLLAHVLGTPSSVETAGKILFLEEVSEYLYSIDRLMVQLRRSGRLDRLAGLIVGSFSGVKDSIDPPFGETAYEIIQRWTRDYTYPVCYGFPVGHEPDNLAMPCGRVATLAVGPDVTLTFAP
jgi:muramoyltetrapeptide carboxypeptidase